jgi:hypothetical protein
MVWEIGVLFGKKQGVPAAPECGKIVFCKGLALLTLRHRPVACAAAVHAADAVCPAANTLFLMLCMCVWSRLAAKALLQEKFLFIAEVFEYYSASVSTVDEFTMLVRACPNP